MCIVCEKTERVISSSGNRKQKIDIWMFAILFWMEESNLLDNSCWVVLRLVSTAGMSKRFTSDYIS